MAEKRKFIRLSIKMLIKWHRKNATLADSDTHLDVVRNISRGGLSFITGTLLEAKEKLLYEIKLPHGPRIKAEGLVKRVKNLSLDTIEKDIEYEAGIEITQISPGHKVEWDTFVFESSLTK